MLKVAKEEGFELTDEQLDAVSGGCYTGPVCPYCGSEDTKFVGNYAAVYECQDCDRRFE